MFSWLKLDRFRYKGVAKGNGMAAMLLCTTHVIAQEAPAWALSMVVHMVTMVTMAMVTVPAPVQYRSAQHLTANPTEEEKVEQPKEKEDKKNFAEQLPTKLEDEPPIEPAIVNGEKIKQEAVEIQGGDIASSPPPLMGSADAGYGPGSLQNSVQLTSLVDKYDEAKNGPLGKNADNRDDVNEECVGRALKWLAEHQWPDGSWSFDHTRCPTCNGQCRDPGKLANARVAATGLALIPFLGSGQTHQKSQNYKPVILAGLRFLVRNIHNSTQGGSLMDSGGNMYSHGIATIALCEAYAMTDDKSLQTSSQAAIRFICTAQDPKGGGWRYQPRTPGDTSVLGWQLMALKCGCMAELDIPIGVGLRASKFLDSVQSNDGSSYGYQLPKAGTDATVAIGLLSRLYLGWKKDNPAIQRGVQWLSKRGPSASDMYYNYYATQVMRHWDGDEWKVWNRQMRDQLLHSQGKQGHERGSWFNGAVDHGSGPGGRLYYTAMASMILEIYYRHLPIYDVKSVQMDFPE